MSSSIFSRPDILGVVGSFLSLAERKPLPYVNASFRTAAAILKQKIVEAPQSIEEALYGRPVVRGEVPHKYDGRWNVTLAPLTARAPFSIRYLLSNPTRDDFEIFRELADKDPEQFLQLWVQNPDPRFVFIAQGAVEALPSAEATFQIIRRLNGKEALPLRLRGDYDVSVESLFAAVREDQREAVKGALLKERPALFLNEPLGQVAWSQLVEAGADPAGLLMRPEVRGYAPGAIARCLKKLRVLTPVLPTEVEGEPHIAYDHLSEEERKSLYQRIPREAWDRLFLEENFFAAYPFMRWQKEFWDAEIAALPTDPAAIAVLADMPSRTQATFALNPLEAAQLLREYPECLPFEDALQVIRFNCFAMRDLGDRLSEPFRSMGREGILALKESGILTHFLLELPGIRTCSVQEVDTLLQEARAFSETAARQLEGHPQFAEIAALSVWHSRSMLQNAWIASPPLREWALNHEILSEDELVTVFGLRGNHRDPKLMFTLPPHLLSRILSVWIVRGRGDLYQDTEEAFWRDGRSFEVHDRACLQIARAQEGKYSGSLVRAQIESRLRGGAGSGGGAAASGAGGSERLP